MTTEREDDPHLQALLDAGKRIPKGVWHTKRPLVATKPGRIND
jgi:hypothetical protein